MHEAYLERVGQWIKAAPAHEWGKDYAKENYSRAYMCVFSMPDAAMATC